VHRRLLVLAPLAAAAAVEAGYGWQPHALAIAASALLFLVLPGAALIELLFERGALDGIRRALFVPMLSLSTSIVIGVALGESHVRLDRRSWAIALGCATGAALAGAFVRAAVSTVAAKPTARPGRVTTVGSVAVLATAGALAIGGVAAALVIATRPVGAEHVAGYTALSLLPVDGSRTLELQVKSVELQTTSYRVLVRVDGGRTLLSTTLALATNGTWSARIAEPAHGVVTAQLFRRSGARYAAYRRAYVRVASQ
jgi:hypothetical protein